MADAELWTAAVGAWVLLTELLGTVEREFNIPRQETARVLRGPLENCTIDAEVVAWDEDQLDCGDWVYLGQLTRVSSEGWHHLDWTTGTLAGHVIRVRWEHVLRELGRSAVDLQIKLRALPTKSLEPSEGQRLIGRAIGGSPPRHDWDAFWIEVALYAAKNDLHLTHRRDLQTHMVAWAAQAWSNPPDDATIRARLARLFGAVADNDSSSGGWSSR